MTESQRSLPGRLRDTRMWRWVVLYGGGALAATEVVDRLGQAFGPMHEPQLQALWILVGAGFPITLILGWYHGEEGHQQVSAIEAGLLATVGLPALLACAILLTRSADAAPRIANLQEAGVAVLPFEHLGHEEDRRRTRGIYAAVVDGLTGVSSLGVIERRSIEALDDSVLSSGHVAAELGVKYVLTGSVEWSDDRLGTQTSVQLVDGTSGVQLGAWSIPARYDDPTQVFAVQEAVARQVARAIRVEVSPSEDDRLTRVPTGDAIAMDHFLMGSIEAGSLGVDAEAARAGIAYMERAVERDPTYGEAWARLAAFRAIARAQHRREFPEITELLLVEALTAAERYAPSAPETQLARGIHAYFYDTDWSIAERRLSRLTREYPNWADGHQMLGIMLRRMDQWPRAVAELEAALALDPRSLTTTAFASTARYMVGHHDAAIELARRAQMIDPSSPAPQVNEVRTLLWGLADTTSALEVLQRTPHDAVYSWMDFVLQLRGDPEGAIRLRERMPMGGQPGSRWQLAMLHRDVGNEATMRMWADSARAMSERGVEACPPAERDTGRWCLQIALAELAIPLAILGDTVAALEAVRASELEHRQFHDGYQSTIGRAFRGLALLELGHWAEATEEYRLLLSRPSFMHPPMLRVTPATRPLRESWPPFLAMLDSIEALGPFLDRSR